MTRDAFLMRPLFASSAGRHETAPIFAASGKVLARSGSSRARDGRVGSIVAGSGSVDRRFRGAGQLQVVGISITAVFAARSSTT